MLTFNVHDVWLAVPQAAQSYAASKSAKGVPNGQME